MSSALLFNVRPNADDWLTEAAAMEIIMRPSQTPAVTLVAGARTRLAFIALTVISVTADYGTLHAGTGRPLATAGAQAAQQEWPSEAYRVEWEEAHVPQEAAAEQTLAVPVTLRNSGNKIWPTSVVFVAYHWFRDKKLVV